MKFTVQKEINYIEETFNLLFNYVNHNSYEKMREEGSGKFRSSDETYNNRFDRIVRISNYVYEHMRFDKSTLEYYFKELGKSKMSLANYILLILPEFQYSTLDEYIAVAKDMDNKKVLEEFDYILSQYYAIGKSGDEVEVTSFEDIIRNMDKLDMSAEEKWKITQAYIDRSRHIDEIAKIYMKTIELLKECKEEIEYIEQEFYSYWTNYIATNDLLKQIKEYIKMSWENSELGTVLVPTVFQPKILTLSIHDKEEGKLDIIHLGIINDSTLTLEPTQVDNESLYNTLKILSDKSKLDILMFIKDKPAYGFELANALNLSTSTISYHMSGLISERLVNIEKDANKVYYSIDKTRINSVLEDVRNLLVR
jgi:DNA-binding transcriptional ArsR family regulator